MTRALANRLTKLEAASQPAKLRVPNVLYVAPGETMAEAARRFDTQYPKRPKHHRVLVVPYRDRTPEDDADFDRRFEEHQAKLVADAKSEARKETDEC